MNTKEKILNESMKLFSVKGFDAVSIRSIADAVGVSNSALYKHYPSKQAIFDDIVEKSKAHFLKQCDYAQNSICVNMESFVQVCISMFDFQINDEWMVMFRRVLLIEQFKNEKMAQIFNDFFIEFPITSQKLTFEKLIEDGIMISKNPEVLAMELYAPFFLYHTAKYDVGKLMELFRMHVEYFYLENFKEGE